MITKMATWFRRLTWYERVLLCLAVFFIGVLSGKL